MSRIYDDKPLSNLPLITIESAQWKTDMSSGAGIGLLIEAVVRKRSRVCINSDHGKKSRYFILHLNIHRAHKRKFEPSGKEITPNFSETQKINKGYLNTYKVEAKGQSDKVSLGEVQSILRTNDTDQIYRRHPTLVTEGLTSLWLPEVQAENIEICDGDSLRITTKHDSPFIENITKMEVETSTVSNFAGEQVGENWTDKILAMKSTVSQPLDDDNDNEWDD